MLVRLLLIQKQSPPSSGLKRIPTSFFSSIACIL
ncbi:hypothetical protein X975_11457, partial [Stegodyphus mimosarum]